MEIGGIGQKQKGSIIWSDKPVGSRGLRGALLPGAFALADAVIQNASVAFGTGPINFTTPREQWAFGVTFPFRMDAHALTRVTGLSPVRIEATAENEGSIGMGCVTSDLRSYVSSEMERTSEDGDTAFGMVPEPLESCGWLVVRDTAGSSVPSRVIAGNPRTFKIEKPASPDLIEVDGPTNTTLCDRAVGAHNQ